MEMSFTLGSMYDKIIDMKLLEDCLRLAKLTVFELKRKNLKIAFSESITGGLLSGLLTSIPDASTVLSESFTVYSNDAKIKILKCNLETIKQYTEYSKETIIEMLQGLSKISQAEVLMAISGVAGPSKPNNFEIGEVFIGIRYLGKDYLYRKNFSGDRNFIRLKAIKFCYEKIIEVINQ
jgi:nicotinamide-nucleotide amidase